MVKMLRIKKNIGNEFSMKTEKYLFLTTPLSSRISLCSHKRFQDQYIETSCKRSESGDDNRCIVLNIKNTPHLNMLIFIIKR